MDEHFTTLKNLKLRDLLASDSARAQKMTLDAAGLRLNYKCNLITDETLPKLAQMAEGKKLSTYVKDMLQGNVVNLTENRPAWHTTLRDPNSKVIEVHETLEKINAICNQMQNSCIKDVVVLGIGGSFWGPKLVVEALSDYGATKNIHFVAELDEAQLQDTLAGLQAKNTCIIIISKSFATPETIVNADRAGQWAINYPQHFIAITSNCEKAREWGVHDENILPMWDWVGGRFSVWSAVGLPIALAYGMDVFRAFLQGAHQMDQHFASQEFTQNMPIILAMLSYAYTQFCDAQTQAVLPYAHRLRSLVPHLQQLGMESLGKRCNMQGEIVNYPTGPIVWGTTGTHGQHTFNQLIHQGNHCIPIDFILVSDGSENAQALRRQCLAQSHTLSFGDPDNTQPHRRIIGCQPHNIIELENLRPETLGALLALYEHKIASLGYLLNINPFDQFGVEHSKALINDL